jgi:hypothetical protein
MPLALEDGEPGILGKPGIQGGPPAEIVDRTTIGSIELGMGAGRTEPGLGLFVSFLLRVHLGPVRRRAIMPFMR